MTERDFCYWLQGYLELAGTDAALTPERVECVRRHLSMVFEHAIDPSYGDKKKQDTLSHLHNSDGKTLIRC
jgi:hypothetical protein